MGAQETAIGKQQDEARAGVGGKVFAKNTGVCVEKPIGEGETGLHLGCGKVHWDGWLNVDIGGKADFVCDIRRLELPSDHAERICAVHVFEHFYLWETDSILKEWLRVLKPGGEIVLELPCMDKVLNHIFLRMKKGQSPSPSFSWFALWGDPQYENVAMTHKWGYGKSDIVQLLEKAGFVDARHEEPNYHFPARDMRVVAYKPQTLARN